MPSRNSGYIKFVFGLGDALLLNIAFVIAYLLKFHLFTGLVVPPYLELWILVNVFWAVLVVAFKPYNVARTTSLKSLLKRHYALVLIHLLLITAFCFWNKAFYYSRVQLIYFFLSFSFFFSVWRLVFVYSLGILRAKGYNIKRVVVVGYDKLTKKLVTHFEEHPEYGYRVSGVFGQNGNDKSSYEDYITQIKQHAIDNKIDEIYCCLPYMEYKHMKNLVNFGHQHTIKIKLTGDFHGLPLEGFKPESYGTIPVFHITSVPLDDWKNRFIKRCFDIGFASLVLFFICSWLFPLIALAIKATSRGPILFKQKRTGLNNNVFYCWKFRTMFVNNQADCKQATKNDPRITPIGALLRKASLDELPQFINVLMGKMSVVGPRPHPVQLNEEFSPIICKFDHRHAVKPGITGLAQAKGYRGETSTFEMMNNRVRLDLFYIEKWFFVLDIKIIFLTIFSLMRGQENAY